MEWRIGCSGYRYPDWKRLFYPEELPEARWFAYYSERFNTVELNATYYRWPRREDLRRLYESTPDDFTFSVKAPWQIISARKFNEARAISLEFAGLMQDTLDDKLEVILLQLPGDFTYEEERLMWLTDLLEPSVRNVLEFRHGSWWNPEVFATLERLQIAFAGMSHPELPADVVATTDLVYYRLHGVPYLYTSEYTPAVLEKLMQRIVALPGVRRACIYFNNSAEGRAVMNALQLQEISAFAH